MKTVLITGAGGNLGRAAVETYLSAEWKVIALVSPGKSLTGFTGNLHVYAVDLADEEVTHRLMSRLVKEHASIDAALLLAGGFAMSRLSTITDAHLHDMIQLNVETAVHIARPLFAHMLERLQGRIILIGSRPALEPRQGTNKIAYALAKGMLLQLANLMNAEGEDKNVITYTVVPDIIDTPENRLAMPKANFNTWKKPEEIAAILKNLCDNSIVLEERIIKLF